ncbi:MAG: hypothetical protein ABIR81_08740 [Ginsengibacter sp.]
MNNENQMPQLLLRQFEYESDTWKRLLGYMIDENIHLKNRLVEILKHIPDRNLLLEIEIFHTRFMKEDDMIILLRNDVAEFDKFLESDIFEGEKISDEIKIKLTKIRNNITNAELQFSRLNLEFNNYLSEMLNTFDREKYSQTIAHLITIF